jgi:hypothetical protein
MLYEVVTQRRDRRAGQMAVNRRQPILAGVASAKADNHRRFKWGAQGYSGDAEHTRADLAGKRQGNCEQFA